MNKTVVINAVGLSRPLLAGMPRTRQFAASGSVATIGHVLPAVTCCVQATYLTGALPREHGIVGNGWYFRDQHEIRFWHQSAGLVQRPRIWDIARSRNRSFTCANICWWNAMYCGADVIVTPRPMYPADGRKIPDIWTSPPELREQLQAELGRFPLFRFWGPATSIESSRWIAEAAIRVDRAFDPTLSLVYLPHLDYALQRKGPKAADVAADLAELDAVVERLLDHFANQRRARVILLSEYGIEAVDRPIHINRVLRHAGLLSIRQELGLEYLDAGASAAFAVADHQVAHVYVNNRSELERVRQVLSGCTGIESILDRAAQQAAGIEHPRSGDLLVVAARGHWFTYYYWHDDAAAPDYARTVDIHRKPGYDPAELFIDPRLALPRLRIAATLLKRRLGFRSLVKVIPLDATLVRGSHGRPPSGDDFAPVFVTSARLALPAQLAPTDVCGLILDVAGV